MKRGSNSCRGNVIFRPAHCFFQFIYAVQTDISGKKYNAAKGERTFILGAGEKIRVQRKFVVCCVCANGKLTEVYRFYNSLFNSATVIIMVSD